MDDNNNAPPHGEDEEDDYNENQVNLNIPLPELTARYQPPLSFFCTTDIENGISLPPTSFLIYLYMPRVPFIINRRPLPNLPSIAVTCGLAPNLSVCDNYEDFAILLCARLSVEERIEGIPSFDDPVPGYVVTYELMAPVQRRVRFGTHDWPVFKSRVRLLVITKR